MQVASEHRGPVRGRWPGRSSDGGHHAPPPRNSLSPPPRCVSQPASLQELCAIERAAAVRLGYASPSASASRWRDGRGSGPRGCESARTSARTSADTHPRAPQQQQQRQPHQLPSASGFFVPSSASAPTRQQGQRSRPYADDHADPESQRQPLSDVTNTARASVDDPGAVFHHNCAKRGKRRERRALSATAGATTHPRGGVGPTAGPVTTLCEPVDLYSDGAAADRRPPTAAAASSSPPHRMPDVLARNRWAFASGAAAADAVRFPSVASGAEEGMDGTEAPASPSPQPVGPRYAWGGVAGAPCGVQLRPRRMGSGRGDGDGPAERPPTSGRATRCGGDATKSGGSIDLLTMPRCQRSISNSNSGSSRGWVRTHPEAHPDPTAARSGPRRQTSIAAEIGEGGDVRRHTSVACSAPPPADTCCAPCCSCGHPCGRGCVSCAGGCGDGFAYAPHTSGCGVQPRGRPHRAMSHCSALPNADGVKSCGGGARCQPQRGRCRLGDDPYPGYSREHDPRHHRCDTRGHSEALSFSGSHTVVAREAVETLALACGRGARGVASEPGPHELYDLWIDAPSVSPPAVHEAATFRAHACGRGALAPEAAGSVHMRSGPTYPVGCCDKATQWTPERGHGGCPSVLPRADGAALGPPSTPVIIVDEPCGGGDGGGDRAGIDAGPDLAGDDALLALEDAIIAARARLRRATARP